MNEDDYRLYPRHDAKSMQAEIQRLRRRVDMLQAEVTELTLALENIAEDEMNVTVGSQRRAWEALKNKVT